MDNEISLHIPLSLRRDNSVMVKIEHLFDGVDGNPCACCKVGINFENYRNIFEEDLKIKYIGHQTFLEIVKREGEGYHHIEAELSWRYFKKGLIAFKEIEPTHVRG